KLTEHLQSMALIRAHVETEHAIKKLAKLPQKMKTDIAKRITIMDRTSPEVISEVEAIMEEKLSATVTQDYTQTGGIESVVEVLNGVDRATEKTILDALEIE